MNRIEPGVIVANGRWDLKTVTRPEDALEPMMRLKNGDVRRVDLSVKPNRKDEKAVLEHLRNVSRRGDEKIVIRAEYAPVDRSAYQLEKARLDQLFFDKFGRLPLCEAGDSCTICKKPEIPARPTKAEKKTIARKARAARPNKVEEMLTRRKKAGELVDFTKTSDGEWLRYSVQETDGSKAVISFNTRTRKIAIG